ncbi:glycosyl hydrolase family 18 protein [Paenibacillus pasadenensis]|uniref:glycosyl hydrolase family 18 protein n=1 Tax=Paenibacillus pasadenensis TaxID=217090 RepID=UPI00040B174D|nr:glycosyl hydrolase family 18 protein [Paenibacillus pasadenensis]
MKFAPLAAAAAFAIGLQALAAPSAGAAKSLSAITQYRVYQNDRPLQEFAKQADAEAYAARYAYSRVERIADRAWLWDNLPRYKVYLNGLSRPEWEYAGYAAARAKADSLPSAQIRDLQQPGWVYSKSPRYRVYQGGSTKPEWAFSTLKAAKAEAARWAKSHIVDIEAAAWIWDSYTAEQAKQARAAKPVYAVETSAGVRQSAYSFLKDAALAAAELPGSRVVHAATGAVLFSREASYEVRQGGKPVARYFALQSALAKAKTLAGSQIMQGGLIWWTNEPYLTVMQGDKPLRSFHTRQSALSYALGYARSRIVTADSRVLWSQPQSLQVLGWSGTSDEASIVAQLAGTQGVDISSPSWYELADASGTLKDDSLPELAAALKQRGLSVQPLVHNGFDPKRTSAFLADGKARAAFVSKLTASLKKLGADGLNLDFESVAGKDRALYSLFVGELGAALRKAGMTLTVDLPRGDTAWDHLTAYDHQAIAEAADRIVIMAYDEHWQGSDEAGPVSSLGWAEGGIQQFLSYGVPRSKLLLGVPFYVRLWELDSSGEPLGSRAVAMKDVPQLISSKPVYASLDEAAGLTKYTYAENGSTYVFWAETEQSVSKRIALARKYDLAGIAAWRLGYEPASLWTAVLKQKQS